MASNRKYWSSVEELKPNSSIADTLKQNEFVEEIPTAEFLGNEEALGASSTSRRDFLKYVGFTTAAASLAACEGPVTKSIPYVVQPENIIPGVANYYATTIANGFDFSSILIKTREGRPIMVEHNKEAKVNGSPNARVYASVLDLYDSLRVQGPKSNGAYTSWDDLDAQVVSALHSAKVSGKQIVLLTQTYASPSTTKLIAEFSEKFGNVKHIQYDAISEDAALDAFESTYGKRALADYDFSKAEVIVSFAADFLGDWQGGGYDAGYAKGRIPTQGKMSRHIQFESNMSLTGANADKRVPLTPSELKIALAKFYGYLNGRSVAGSLPAHIDEAVKATTAQVARAGRKAVVVTGISDVNAQKVVLAINKTISSEVMDVNKPKLTRQGNVKALNQLVADMNDGKVGVLVTSNVNPLYTMPNAAEFEAGLAKVGLSVAFSLKEDETASKTTYVAAAPHYLESWGDVEMKKGMYSLMQPTIRPLFNTRQFQDPILKWTGNSLSYHDYIKQTWEASILGLDSWNQALHDGVYEASFVASETAQEDTVTAAAEAPQTEAEAAVASVADAVRTLAGTTSLEGMELTFYSKISMGDGQQANNPWLQELPDPLTRNTWDNYLTISMADAERLDIENYTEDDGGLNGSYAKVTVGDVTLDKVPVLIQPGQAKNTVGLSFGYGRKLGLKTPMQTGVNAYTLYQGYNLTQPVTIEKVSGIHEFASVQMKSTMDGRGDILRETSLEIFNTKDSEHWNPQPVVSVNHAEVPADDATLWSTFDSSIGHHFNLSIDLNACTGCGACVIACHAENNVPVVGKSEVRKYRDMHWLRIDRYYSSEETFEGDMDMVEAAPNSISTYHKLEHPSEN